MARFRLRVIDTAGPFPVLSGEDVFRAHDTHGVPLAIQVGLMLARKLTFDVKGFVRAATA